MEGIKISELEELPSVTGDEYIPVVDSDGANKKVKTGGDSYCRFITFFHLRKTNTK